MKESDITPEIIAKAKEIAEHWRMEIYEGCYFAVESSKKDDWEGIDAKIFTPPEIYMTKNIGGGRYYGYASPENGCGSVFSEDPHDYCLPDKWFPIPSISDCLEKLREFAEENIQIFIDASLIWFVTINAFSKKSKVTESKNLHEALLTALLSVLKEQP